MEPSMGASNSTRDRQGTDTDTEPPSQNNPSTRSSDQAGEQTGSPTRMAVPPASFTYPREHMFRHQQPDGTYVLRRLHCPVTAASSSSSYTAANAQASHSSPFTIIPPNWSNAWLGTLPTAITSSHIHDGHRAAFYECLPSADTAQRNSHPSTNGPVPAPSELPLERLLEMSKKEEYRVNNSQKDHRHQQPQPQPHRAHQNIVDQPTSSTSTFQRAPAAQGDLNGRMMQRQDNAESLADAFGALAIKDDYPMPKPAHQAAAEAPSELPREPERLRELIMICEYQIRVHVHHMRREQLPSRRRPWASGATILQERLSRLKKLLEVVESQEEDQCSGPGEAGPSGEPPSSSPLITGGATLRSLSQVPQQSSGPGQQQRQQQSSKERLTPGQKPGTDSLVAAPSSASSPGRAVAGAPEPAPGEPALRRSRGHVQLNVTFRQQAGQPGHSGDHDGDAGEAHYSRNTTTDQEQPEKTAQPEQSEQPSVRARKAGSPNSVVDEDGKDGVAVDDGRVDDVHGGDFEEIELPKSEQDMVMEEGWEEDEWEDLGSERAPRVASQNPSYPGPRPGFVASFLRFPQTRWGV